jgi:hypothetical protein
VNRITCDGLIQVTYLYGNPSIDAGNRTQIPGVAIATNPDRRSFRKGTALLGF